MRDAGCNLGSGEELVLFVGAFGQIYRISDGTAINPLLHRLGICFYTVLLKSVDGLRLAHARAMRCEKRVVRRDWRNRCSSFFAAPYPRTLSSCPLQT